MSHHVPDRQGTPPGAGPLDQPCFLGSHPRPLRPCQGARPRCPHGRPYLLLELLCGMIVNQGHREGHGTEHPRVCGRADVGHDFYFPGVRTARKAVHHRVVRTAETPA
ncbi:hypothetical protein P7K49_000029 [Saguinus oedipus]|uniref:Uncharacterized protein n=1 Tax=Saguinus oedipus TaxID=9490 RepID=A0ABQ9WCY2_SAGOE|nr:hypothetical protein P7K49_000029 [Saguinus oedipus]